MSSYTSLDYAALQKQICSLVSSEDYRDFGKAVEYIVSFPEAVNLSTKFNRLNADDIPFPAELNTDVPPVSFYTAILTEYINITDKEIIERLKVFFSQTTGVCIGLQDGPYTKVSLVREISNPKIEGVLNERQISLTGLRNILAYVRFSKDKGVSVGSIAMPGVAALINAICVWSPQEKAAAYTKIWKASLDAILGEDNSSTDESASDAGAEMTECERLLAGLRTIYNVNTNADLIRIVKGIVEKLNAINISIDDLAKTRGEDLKRILDAMERATTYEDRVALAQCFDNSTTKVIKPYSLIQQNRLKAKVLAFEAKNAGEAKTNRNGVLVVPTVTENGVEHKTGIPYTPSLTVATDDMVAAWLTNPILVNTATNEPFNPATTDLKLAGAAVYTRSGELAELSNEFTDSLKLTLSKDKDAVNVAINNAKLENNANTGPMDLEAQILAKIVESKDSDFFEVKEGNDQAGAEFNEAFNSEIYDKNNYPGRFGVL